MSVYLPSTLSVAALVFAYWLTACIWGYCVTKFSLHWARTLAWTTLVVGVLAIHVLLLNEPAGFRMLALISIALLNMKTVVVVESRASGMTSLKFMDWAGFSMGWVGMRPSLFANRAQHQIAGGNQLIKKGIHRFLIGIGFFVSARLGYTLAVGRWLTASLLMVGLSFMMHFGVFNVLAGVWRKSGVRTESVFHAPLLSQSLSEFWAKRWNLAFSEMTSIGVYRPLAAKVGRPAALFAAFLMSGLLHEMAITIPVKSGFGLPLAYFAIHGFLVFIERVLASREIQVTGVWGRVWTFFWVLVPLPLLFHKPFVNGVVLPMIGA